MLSGDAFDFIYGEQYDWLDLLRNGAAFWNEWAARTLLDPRKKNPTRGINLSGVVFEIEDLSGFIFPVSVIFTRSTFANSVNFNNCVFIKELVCRGSKFQEKARFTGARFQDRAIFDNCTFFRDIDFSKAIFFKGANFSRSRFQNNSQFTYTEFHGRTTFRNASFSGETNFAAADFKSYVNLSTKGGRQQLELLLKNKTPQSLRLVPMEASESGGTIRMVPPSPAALSEDEKVRRHALSVLAQEATQIEKEISNNSNIDTRTSILFRKLFYACGRVEINIPELENIIDKISYRDRRGDFDASDLIGDDVRGLLRTATTLAAYFPELARYRAHMAVATVETEHDPRKIALDAATEVRKSGNDLIVHISVAHALESVAAGALRENSGDETPRFEPSDPARSEDRAATGGLVAKLHWLLERAKDGTDGIQRADKATTAAISLYSNLTPIAQKAWKFFSID